MKIAFGGPSGSGKTTLASHIHERTGIRQIQSFETRQFPKDRIDLWKEHYGYSGDVGHKALINLQNKYPIFGMDWQYQCLLSRGRVIREVPSFVMDRSPLDNVVYMLSQVGHNMTEEEIMKFIYRAQEDYKNLTHFIRIRTTESQDNVENNNSRVANLPWQVMISDIFEGVFQRYFQHIDDVEVLTLTDWDLEERKSLVNQFLR